MIILKNRDLCTRHHTGGKCPLSIIIPQVNVSFTGKGGDTPMAEMKKKPDPKKPDTKKAGMTKTEPKKAAEKK